MTQFLDKLTEALSCVRSRAFHEYRTPNSVTSAIPPKERMTIPEARQQILAAIEACSPTKAVKPPKDQPYYQEAVNWQHGYNQAIDDFKTALGISQSKGDKK